LYAPQSIASFPPIFCYKKACMYHRLFTWHEMGRQSPAHHSLSCHRRVWCPFLSLFFPFPLTPSNPKQRPDLSILGITRYHPNVITILRYLLSWMPLWASAVWGQLALGSLMHVASYFCLALRTLIYQDTAHITLSLPTVTFSLFGIISLFKIYF